jgi:hypothetical protein
MRDAIDHALPPLTCTQATNLTLLMSHLPAYPPDHRGYASWHATGAQIHKGKKVQQSLVDDLRLLQVGQVAGPLDLHETGVPDRGGQGPPLVRAGDLVLGPAQDQGGDCDCGQGVGGVWAPPMLWSPSMSGRTGHHGHPQCVSLLRPHRLAPGRE